MDAEHEKSQRPSISFTYQGLFEQFREGLMTGLQTKQILDIPPDSLSTFLEEAERQRRWGRDPLNLMRFFPRTNIGDWTQVFADCLHDLAYWIEGL